MIPPSPSNHRSFESRAMASSCETLRILCHCNMAEAINGGDTLARLEALTDTSLGLQCGQKNALLCLLALTDVGAWIRQKALPV